MALKLEAQYRWCVSGTPVGRGKMEDLYGLLLFLRLDPFFDSLTFKRCFDPAYRQIRKRIQHLLSKVFWRSTKNYDLVGKHEEVDVCGCVSFHCQCNSGAVVVRPKIPIVVALHETMMRLSVSKSRDTQGNITS